MNEIKELLIALGGPSNVARKCGLSRSAVSQWVRRQAIPTQHALIVSSLASQFDISLTPEQILQKVYKM
jgi:DNA-binding transcriptional regulator YdaS (Cro superfamily)